MKKRRCHVSASLPFCHVAFSRTASCQQGLSSDLSESLPSLVSSLGLGHTKHRSRHGHVGYDASICIIQAAGPRKFHPLVSSGYLINRWRDSYSDAILTGTTVIWHCCPPESGLTLGCLRVNHATSLGWIPHKTPSVLPERYATLGQTTPLRLPLKFCVRFAFACSGNLPE